MVSSSVLVSEAGELYVGILVNCRDELVRKFVHGLISAGIVTGLILIFAGRQLYPEFSKSFRVIWMICGGILVGGATGYFLRNFQSISAGVIIGCLFGGVGFGLLGLLLQLPALVVIGSGCAIGGISGLYIQVWSGYGVGHSQSEDHSRSGPAG